MKSLRPIALLALSAAAAQAYNLEFQFGTSKAQAGDVAGSYNSDSATAIAWSFNATEQISLGLTYGIRTLEHTGPALTTNDVKTLTFDVTYELAPSQSGIKPFVGLNLGNSWIDTSAGNETAITGKINAGLRFDISDSVDLVLGARYFVMYDVQYAGTPTPAEENVKGWESFAGVRLKF